jgi:hypothetical protein
MLRQLLLAAVLAGCATAPPPPPPPCGVVVDGVLNAAEWQSAQRLDLSGGAVLWLIQAPEHVCIAAETRPAGLRFVDIFLTDGAGVTQNLHASMQVGERTLPARGWTDETPATAWGQTTGWRANAVARVPGVADSAPVAEQLAPYEGYEFVIANAARPRPWRMRVEVRDFAGQARDIVWPAQSRRADPASWALLP